MALGKSIAAHFACQVPSLRVLRIVAFRASLLWRVFRYPGGRDGSGQDPPEHQHPRVYVREPGRERAAHHSGAEEHALELDERDEALVSRPSAPSLPRNPGTRVGVLGTLPGTGRAPGCASPWGNNPVLHFPDGLEIAAAATTDACPGLR